MIDEPLEEGRVGQGQIDPPRYRRLTAGRRRGANICPSATAGGPRDGELIQGELEIPCDQGRGVPNLFTPGQGLPRHGT